MSTNSFNSISELIDDHSFRRLVNGTASSEEISRWSRWIEKSEVNRAKARQASAEILGFEFADPKIPDLEEEWHKLYKSTNGKNEVSYSGTADKDSAMRWIFRVAAVLLIISGVGIGSYLYQHTNHHNTPRLEQITEQKTVTTGENERKTLKFSNGAKIILNEHTTLTYTLSLLQSAAIKVTMRGEAYFKTDGQSASLRPMFSIITPDGTIEDIGTEFLVRVEEEKSRVVLQEGMVKVKVHNGKTASDELRVQRDEIVDFNETAILAKQTVNSSFYTSWATGFITFSQTKVKEFADFVEQLYKVKVQIASPELADITLDGAVYFRSLEDLVRSFSKVTEIPVYQSQERDTLYIGI